MHMLTRHAITPEKVEVGIRRRSFFPVLKLCTDLWGASVQATENTSSQSKISWHLWQDLVLALEPYEDPEAGPTTMHYQ